MRNKFYIVIVHKLNEPRPDTPHPLKCKKPPRYLKNGFLLIEPLGGSTIHLNLKIVKRIICIPKYNIKKGKEVPENKMDVMEQQIQECIQYAEQERG